MYKACREWCEKHLVSGTSVGGNTSSSEEMTRVGVDFITVNNKQGTKAAVAYQMWEEHHLIIHLVLVHLCVRISNNLCYEVTEHDSRSRMSIMLISEVLWEGVYCS